MSCFNGQMVMSSQCFQPECDFSGLQCVNQFGNPVPPDTCSSFFSTCTSGQLSPPIPTGYGTFCLNGAPVYDRNCESHDDTPKCSFVGVKCVDPHGHIWENTETHHYIMCTNGVVTDPIPVPEGSVCFNNQFILETKVSCDAAVERCASPSIQCVNSYGSVVENKCTSFYRGCVDERTTAPLATPDGYMCYNSAFVPQSICPAYDIDSCSFCRNRCVDENGVAEYEKCTQRYVTCVNGTVSSPQEVPSGSSCYKGYIVASAFCPISEYCKGCPRGPAGPTGPEGPTGLPGMTGATGITGATGATGPMGPAGPTGLPGPTGMPGVEGPMGPEGRMGSQGSQGAAGPEGPIGPEGPAGPTGIPGVAGPQGPQGVTGAMGETGPMGPQGEMGPTGEAGAQGPQGPTGATGPTGPQGPQGEAGATGPEGPQGETGATGATGAKGATGATGGEGPEGPSGAPGPVGEVTNVDYFQTIMGATNFLLNSRIDNLPDTATTSNLVLYRRSNIFFDGLDVQLTWPSLFPLTRRREYQYICSSNPQTVTTIPWPCTTDSCPSVASVTYGTNPRQSVSNRRRKRNVHC